MEIISLDYSDGLYLFLFASLTFILIRFVVFVTFRLETFVEDFGTADMMHLYTNYRGFKLSYLSGSY